MNATRSATDKAATYLILGVAAAVVAGTAILMGWPGILLIFLATCIVGGLAAFLKLKNLWARIAGLVLFGISLFWLVTLPFWLMHWFGN